MIAQEFLLLGLLKESPKHGYQIKKEIKEIFSLFAGLDLKSIYYPLGVLEKKGLVVKRINKPGRRPQRLVYELTKKGEARFSELLTKSFLDFKRPKFSLDLSLYFLHHMKPKIVKRRLRARMLILAGVSKGLKQMVSSFKKRGRPSLVYILEHNLQMLQTEAKFLKNLTQILE
jgi:DNA-binding PadR family transcriptional regulator